MKQKDHLALGRYLISAGMINRTGALPPLCRLAFLSGCVLPDYLPHTYLHGFRKSHAMRGHHTAYSKRHIQTVLARLQKRGIRHHGDLFRLGLLLHYVADSFTYAHTAAFPGDMREHRRYELRLHATFLGYLQAEKQTKEELRKDLLSALRALRRQYEAEREEFLRDCIYILRATQMIFEEIFFGQKQNSTASI